MGRDTDNEMRQIQQGLEAFLQQELQEMEAERAERQTQPRIYDTGEDVYGDKDADKYGEYGEECDEEYGEYEDEEYEEEYGYDGTEGELEIIGSTSGRRKEPVKRRERTDYYIEDWDSPERPGRTGRVPQGRSAPPKRRAAQAGGTAPGESAGTPGKRGASGRRGVSGNQRAPGGQGVSGRKGTPGNQGASGRRGTSGNQGASGGRGTSGNQEVPGRQSSRKESAKQQKKSGRKRGSVLRKLLVTAVLLIVLAGGGLYFLVGKVYGKMNFEPIDSVAELPMQEDGVINILLIGNDSRENGEDGRSDAMILVSISSRTKSVYMTSLLRDMYVEIPGHDGNRLNAAYAFGGAELLMETIEQNLDVPVNRYVLVNFEAFAKLVDAVDGVDLELTTEELEYVNGYLVEYNMLTNRPQGTDNMDTSRPGLVHLNGAQALAYCRNRYIGTDFGRTERQRKVLTAVIKKLPSVMGTNTQELIDGLMPNLTTNLTQGECYRLGLTAGKLLTYDIVSDSIPQPDTYSNATIRKMAVLEVDFEANSRYLKEKLYGETEG